MLEIKGVYKSFYKKKAVEDISFSVKEGEIFGLLGPNGAGKSTVIRMINQIITPDSGEIKFKGKHIVSKHLDEIGYLPEERGLYKSMTVQQHAIFLGRLRNLSKAEALRNFELKAEKLGVIDWRKKRIEELSKGMAQKVQFLCTILHEPDLLILDEPFSGFDPINVDLIKNELALMRAEGKTIMLSTHNMKSVEEICDRAVLINNGKKVLDGKITELRKAKSDGLFAIQFQGSMIAMVNALWTGYELVDKKVLTDDRFIAYLKMRGENEFNDLLQTLIPAIKIESAWEVLPSMEEVFIQEVQGKEATDEK